VDEPGDRSSAAAGWSLACALERLIDQGIVCARVADTDLILIWNDGRAAACERACPHEQADLSRGHLSGGRLVCPRHAASFDLENGSISEGWASKSLRIYPVRVDQGEVWIQIDASA
jgi:3-phenylpropionate/trans-cinnamate dioxygenase ferredoxin component